MCASSDPPSTMSAIRRRRAGNLRMVRAGPFNASGAMIAFTREPSRSLASTMGELSSMRRPSGETMRSITPRTDWSLLNTAGCLRRTPPHSTYSSSCRLTMISEMSGSASKDSSGPSPTASSTTCRRSAPRSRSVGISASASSTSASNSRSASCRKSASLIADTSRRRRSRASSRRACSRRRHSTIAASWVGTAMDRAAGMPADTGAGGPPSRETSSPEIPTDRTRSITAPTTISSSGNSGPYCRMRRPLTKVPPSDPRSSTNTPSIRSSSRACRRATRQWRRRISHPSPRPITAGDATHSEVPWSSSVRISTSSIIAP